MRNLALNIRIRVTILRLWKSSHWQQFFMKTYVVYVNGHEQLDPISAHNHDEAMMIAMAKYPNKLVRVFLETY